MINILSFDPSLRNWGIAACTYFQGNLEVVEVHIAKTSNTKGIKQNASDIMAASSLYKEIIKGVEWADVICIEVPHGSQSS